MELTERQQTILDTAMRIIATEGLRALSTRHLAEEVGITEPAIYRHFRNKETLIQELIRQINEKFGSLLQSISNPDLSALDNLMQMLDKVLVYLEQNWASSNTILSLAAASEDPAFQPELAVIGALGQSSAEQQLLQGIEDGSIRRDIPVEQLAFLVLSMVVLHIQKWKSAGNSFSLHASWQPNARMLEVLLAET